MTRADEVSWPMTGKKRDMRENYGTLATGRDFSHSYWRSQPPEAVFDAAADLIRDYLLLREGHAELPRLQRTVESYRKF